MLKLLNTKLRRFFLLRWWPLRRRSSRCKVVITKKPKNDNPKPQTDPSSNLSTISDQNAQMGTQKHEKPIRIATFNAALFSMAPAVPPQRTEKAQNFDDQNGVASKQRRPFDQNSRPKSTNEKPRSILKRSHSHSPLHHHIPCSENRALCISNKHQQQPQHHFSKSKLRVSINLPDNEISMLRNRQPSFSEHEKVVIAARNGWQRKTVVEVLKEVGADILGLQEVKAEEENGMKPLSDLAKALGMDHFVFAESWAPQFGNAVLSKWPIKRWTSINLFDHSDFRNVLKATIDVPQVGELNFYCTHLDHLDENWRMKQINAIIQSNDEPHILAGGLNSLDESDYSQERWTDIVKYYEEMGKPTPKVEVMKYLKSKQYTDAKDFAGECESVVVIAKGQSVQGTCKYGTRVDYILSSSNCSYKFVPGSYLVLSSKGTSDHHIVRADVMKVNSNNEGNNVTRKTKQERKQKVIRITHETPSKGIWKTHHGEIY
ncbi:hypothetical protein HN51_048840 [Arachis hypogaea]|uniref:Endonuclease/exonuclease/phosphatase domain-containing protein n=1 Tax=Arachis hypogaea TaxID=3818 RepID=A0A445E8Q8_ARAHY|nr:uncharacterized protein LOC107626095 isoform X1 [Arachis ipaensis]XP_025634384.1 uncharacterized protein LOC112728461 isoform X1 [Arachis hypogaea]QHO25468.1 uncharacterized protein DS421_12g381330 [Arachis hypogaea]RYR71817.1 hypothetical protein Ahy_A02g006039 [Arachis hypogaea]